MNWIAGEDLDPGDPVYLGQDGKLYKSPPNERQATQLTVAARLIDLEQRITKLEEERFFRELEDTDLPYE